MDFRWEEGYTLEVRIRDGAAVISANREGLISLSNHLRALAEESPGSHIHLDEWNSLGSGSSELIIEKLRDCGG